MCNKKRLGQTAARLLVGMAVGLAGGAFAADSIVPVNWNVTPITDGAYRETFESAPTWDRAVATAAADSRATVARRGLGDTWFPGGNINALTLPGDASYTNTLKYTGNSANVSFATNPVFVDMRIQFTAYEGAPSVGDAKLAVFVSAADKIHVVHNSGTTTNTWSAADLLTAWHQLTVRLEKDGKCAVYLDDVGVTNNLTPIVGGVATELTSLVFTGSGYADDLYVSHGNPNYPATTPGAIPSGVAGVGNRAGSVTNWLAKYFNDGRLSPNAVFTGLDLDRAYLLNMAPTNAPTDPVTSTTFGVAAIDLVTPTLVKVTCKLTVNGSNREDPINGRLRLQGKTTIGGSYDTMSPDAVSPQYTDFNGGLATYDFTVPSGMKFFKAQIVE